MIVDPLFSLLKWQTKKSVAKKNGNQLKLCHLKKSKASWVSIPKEHNRILKAFHFNNWCIGERNWRDFGAGRWEWCWKTSQLTANSLINPNNNTQLLKKNSYELLKEWKILDIIYSDLNLFLKLILKR
jgi:hypothetical protein